MLIKYVIMRNFIRYFILILTIFLTSFMPCLSIENLKIENLMFDNADGIIFVETKGEINELNTIKKGYLKEPDRIYIDIENSILTTPKKEYIQKYSSLNNVKISQFSTNPDIVRLVFEYNNNLELANFKVLKSNKGLFIKLKKDTVKSPKLKTVYNNTKTEERNVYCKGTKAELVQEKEADDTINKVPSSEILNEVVAVTKKDTEKEKSKITASNYYISSVSSAKNGFLINGAGKINVIPSFKLTNPDRLIIDLDDTIVNPEIRNSVYNINSENQTGETLKIGQNNQSIARLVIEGENAKDYRWIISPDSKTMYLTNKKNVINTTMSDINANLKKSAYSNSNGQDIIALTFDDSVCYGIFEENSNLYLDIVNLETFEDEILDPIKRAGFEYKTIRLALDKFRFIVPIGEKTYNVKTNPDNTEIRIATKPVVKERKSIGSILLPVAATKKDTSEISNYFTVVIDAGHGGSDVGATREGIYEKDITLKIAKMIEKNLNKKKVKTYMVRNKDIYVSLADRSIFSNEKNPDLFVSIHVNSSTNEEITGIETHWWKEDSLNYAKSVHNEMTKKNKTWKTKDRGLFKSQFYVINHTEAPAILCEIGFISNTGERNEIIKEKRQQEIADAISDGIYNYLKTRK